MFTWLCAQLKATKPKLNYLQHGAGMLIWHSSVKTGNLVYKALCKTQADK
jgi:hypothetical protein